MKKGIRNPYVLALASAMVLSAFSLSACAKGNKLVLVRSSTPPSGDVSAAVSEPSAVAPEAAASSAAVTLEDAEDIALSHAGADRTSVEFSKAKQNKGVYELKFSDENGKYEYEISAADGTILDCDWELRTPAGEEPSPAEEGAVTQDQASQIALDDAGVSRDALKYLVCYVSWSSHVPTAYEVKFATRHAAYRYTIDLDTGAILGSVCHSHP